MFIVDERKRIWIDQKSLTYRFRSKPAYNDEMYRIVGRTRKINNLKKTASAAAVFLVQVYSKRRFSLRIQRRRRIHRRVRDDRA